jgi:hypothetical protein
MPVGDDLTPTTYFLVPTTLFVRSYTQKQMSCSAICYDVHMATRECLLSALSMLHTGEREAVASPSLVKMKRRVNPPDCSSLFFDTASLSVKSRIIFGLSNAGLFCLVDRKANVLNYNSWLYPIIWILWNVTPILYNTYNIHIYMESHLRIRIILWPETQ